MDNIFIVIVLISIALIIIFMWYNKAKVNKTFTADPSPEQAPEKMNILSKNFKLISYKEAIEASKKFIFDIAKAVIQKFTPDDQKNMTREGRVLYNKGMRYVHVVDVLALSVQKERDVSLNKFAKAKKREVTRR
jgi:hypothetical protein